MRTKWQGNIPLKWLEGDIGRSPGFNFGGEAKEIKDWLLSIDKTKIIYGLNWLRQTCQTSHHDGHRAVDGPTRWGLRRAEMHHVQLSWA